MRFTFDLFDKLQYTVRTLFPFQSFEHRMSSLRILTLEDDSMLFQPEWMRGIGKKSHTPNIHSLKIVDVNAFISSIYNGSSADYIRYNILPKDFPYEIMVIINLSRALQLTNWDPSEADNHWIVYQYMKKLFLKHYQPYQLPKLYASILEGIYHYIAGDAKGLGGKNLSYRCNLVQEIIQCYEMEYQYERCSKFPLSPKLYQWINKICFPIESTTLLLCRSSVSLSKILTENEKYDQAAKYMLKSMECCILRDTSHSVCDIAQGIDAVIYLIKFFEYSVIRFDASPINANTIKQNSNLSKNSTAYFLSRKHHIWLLEIIKHLLLKKIAKYIELFSVTRYVDRFTRIWVIIGDIYYRREMNLERAIQCYEKAISSYYKLGIKMHTNLMMPYHRLYQIYDVLGQHNQCIKYLNLQDDILTHKDYCAFDKERQIELNNHMINDHQKLSRKRVKENETQRREMSVAVNCSTYNEAFGSIDDETKIEMIKYFSGFRLRTINNICQLKECHYPKCLKKSVILKKCKQCKCVFYCSRKCQKSDWNAAHGHRKTCKILMQQNAKRCLGNDLQTRFANCSNFNLDKLLWMPAMPMC